MNPPASKRQQFSLAFTLIELLTVIAIIAILMGLLFPAMGAIKEKGRQTQAKNDIMNIVTAVKGFNTEYSQYPRVTTAAGAASDTGVGEQDAGLQTENSELFNVLRAIPTGVNAEHKVNPRRIVYIEGKSVANAAQPRGGFLEKGTGTSKGAFYDPWGKQYCVVWDADYDNVVKVTTYYSDVPEDESPRTGVVAFSLGKDNKLGTDGNRTLKDADDQVSWR